MARSMNHIRDEIERVLDERADLFRRQQAGGYVFSADLAFVRAGCDARLRLLWEELRQARADVVRVASMSDGEARLVVARVPRLALA